MGGDNPIPKGQNYAALCRLAGLVSTVALAWAFSRAPMIPPTDRSVLIALADHADADGVGAFPSVERICRWTSFSERTVRSALDRLERVHRLIVPTNPAIIAARIGDPGRRPKGFDLLLHVTEENYQDYLGGVQLSHPSDEEEGVQLPHRTGAAPAPKPTTRTSVEHTTTEEPMSHVAESDGDEGALIPVAAIRPDTPPLTTDTGEAAVTGADVPRRLANHLADCIERAGFRRPNVTAAWVTTMDRLVRIDGFEPAHIAAVATWATQDDFWCANIRSPQKLRHHFEALDRRRLQEQRRSEPAGFAAIRRYLDQNPGEPA